MCFNGNQHPWAIKHLFISLYSKYHSLNFIYFPVMNSPVFPSLDDIYCIYSKGTDGGDETGKQTNRRQGTDLKVANRLTYYISYMM